MVPSLRFYNSYIAIEVGLPGAVHTDRRSLTCLQARLAEAEESLRKVQIALGHSSDMRSTLDEQQQQTEHARNVLGLLGVLHLTTVSQDKAAS